MKTLLAIKLFFLGVFLTYTDGEGKISKNGMWQLNHLQSKRSGRSEFLANDIQTKQDRSGTLQSLTCEQEDEMERIHNDLRSSIRDGEQSDMQCLRWNRNLAESSAAHVIKCNTAAFDFGSMGSLSVGFTSYATNGPGRLSFTEAVLEWFVELSNCIASSDVTGCTHNYMQIMNARTSTLGCSMAACPSIGNQTSGGMFLVCHYAPRADLSGRDPVLHPPYSSGPVCSNCPAGVACLVPRYSNLCCNSIETNCLTTTVLPSSTTITEISRSSTTVTASEASTSTISQMSSSTPEATVVPSTSPLAATTIETTTIQATTIETTTIQATTAMMFTTSLPQLITTTTTTTMDTTTAMTEIAATTAAVTSSATKMPSTQPPAHETTLTTLQPHTTANSKLSTLSLFAPITSPPLTSQMVPCFDKPSVNCALIHHYNYCIRQPLQNLCPKSCGLCLPNGMYVPRPAALRGQKGNRTGTPRPPASPGSGLPGAAGIPARPGFPGFQVYTVIMVTYGLKSVVKFTGAPGVTGWNPTFHGFTFAPGRPGLPAFVAGARFMGPFVTDAVPSPPPNAVTGRPLGTKQTSLLSIATTTLPRATILPFQIDPRLLIPIPPSLSTTNNQHAFGEPIVPLTGQQTNPSISALMPWINHHVLGEQEMNQPNALLAMLSQSGISLANGVNLLSSNAGLCQDIIGGIICGFAVQLNYCQYLITQQYCARSCRICV